MTPKLSDMPIGWVTDFTKTSKHQCTASAMSGLQKTAQTGKNVTPAFKKSNTTEVEGAAVMFATVSEPQTAYRRYTSHATLTCETRVLGAGVKSDANGATVGTATSGIVNFPTIGERSQVARVDVPFSASGLSTDLYAGPWLPSWLVKNGVAPKAVREPGLATQSSPAGVSHQPRTRSATVADCYLCVKSHRRHPNG